MKTKIIIFGFVFIFIVSWITFDLGISSEVGKFGIEVPALSDEIDISFLKGILVAFWSLVTFEVSGMPYVINILFLIISMVILFVIFTEMILPILRSNHWVLLGIGILAALIGVVIGFLEFFKGFKFWSNILIVSIRIIRMVFING